MLVSRADRLTVARVKGNVVRQGVCGTDSRTGRGLQWPERRPQCTFSTGWAVRLTFVVRETYTMPRDEPLLRLHQQVLLLALRDREGTVVGGAMYQYTMAGGLLAELLLGKRIEVEESKKKYVNVMR